MYLEGFLLGSDALPSVLSLHRRRRSLFVQRARQKLSLRRSTLQRGAAVADCSAECEFAVKECFLCFIIMPDASLSTPCLLARGGGIGAALPVTVGASPWRRCFPVASGNIAQHHSPALRHFSARTMLQTRCRPLFRRVAGL
jgi:hypothetical protein